MFKLKYCALATGIAALIWGIPAQAQVSQTPLISKTSGVTPNIVYIFDDSGSMIAKHLYQYGGSAGGYGMGGPENLSQGSNTAWKADPDPTHYPQVSPDVNLITYDPRIRYSPRVNADGTFQTVTATKTSSGSFSVYFYNPSNTNIYSVRDITVQYGGSGYPSSGVTAVFNNAPVGGTNAQATVTVSPVSIVSSAQVTSAGSGYSAFSTDKSTATPSNKVTFGAPPSGGITATGYFTTTASKGVASIAIADMGSGYPAAGTFPMVATAPPSGVTASATATIGTTKTVSGVNIANHGAGYGNGPFGVTFTGGTLATGGVAATGTAYVTKYYSVNTTASSVVGGVGYTSAPTVTISAPPAGGVTATGTATVAYTLNLSYVISSTNGGNNYTSSPTVTLTGGGGSCSSRVATVVLKKVTAVTLAGCSTFTSMPTISFSGGGGGATQASSFSATASGGSVTGVNISGGSGYLTAPTISFGGPGTGASATATLAGGGSNGISSITITPGTGYGYTTVPTGVTITGASPTTAATLSVVGSTTFSVTGVSGIVGGAGYAVTPIFTLSSSAGTPTTAPSFTSTLGTTNVVSSIVITNPGSGYSGTPACSIGVTPGSGATCSVTMGTTNTITAITVTDHGSGYTSTPKLTINSPTTGSVVCNATSPAPSAQCVVNTDVSVKPGINAQWNGFGTPTTASSYFTTIPAGFTKPGYLPDANPDSALASGALLVPYPNIADSTTSQYPKFANRTDCAANYCTWAEELLNWNTYYQYHSTRLDLAKTGIGLAFQPLSGTFRLGWASLNTVGVTGGTLDAGVRTFDSSTRSSFFTWLYSRTWNGSTPSRIAVNNVGNYYKRKDDNGPWADTPPACANCSTDPSTGTANANHASCRRSYSVFMTDGYYNDTYTQSPGDVDSTTKTVGSYTYNPTGPFSDTKTGTAFSNTFADVAMNYWLQDLRPDLNDNLKSKPTDPATWQHMNFYAIGLGLVGTLDATDPQTLSSLTGNSTRLQDWPTPKSNDQTAIDDMWHATLNGRGLMLNARNANQLKDSILKIISDVSGKEDSQSGVAISMPSLTAETVKYTPWYTPGYWIGNVRAWHLDPITAAEVCGPNPTVTNTCPAAWEIETLTGNDPITGTPNYTSLIPAFSTRNILVGNGNTSGVRAESFNSSMSAGLQTAMGGTVNAKLINYLRGDASNESSVGSSSSTTGIYRGRVSRLGDIVNSTPTFTYRTAAIDYSSVPSLTGFSTYKAAKEARTEGMLFVGANDGMIHGFRNGKYNYTGGVLTSVAEPGGTELFAFIPRAILPKLSQLSDIGYSHRYYVDGRTTEADTFINGAWANVVLGSTGAGAGVDSSAGKSPGTSVFAIDVTKLNDNNLSWPCSGSSCTLNANSVLWEVGSQLSSSFAELGYMLSDVQAGPTLDGNWVAIFGNGYESASCKAQLFVVNMANGSLIKKIDTGVGSCGSASTKNGLGGVALVRNSNKQIIGAYAGDLQGNMWKFNLNDANNSNWKVEFGGDPLYSAGASQPITAPPTVIDLTDPNVWSDGVDTAPKPGYMVVFGTGKLYETADVTSTGQQSVYGVWDEFGSTSDPIAKGTPRVTKSMLVARNIEDTSQLVITDTTKRGWYADFKGTGDRQIYPLALFDGKHNVMTLAVSPAGLAADACTTGTGGTSTPNPLDALWVTVQPDPPVLCTGASCPTTPNPSVCIGKGCSTTVPVCVYKCSSPIQGASAFIQTDQKCQNGAPLVKQIFAEEVSCSCGPSTTTTKSIDICADVGKPATTAVTKTRKWRELFLR